MLKFIIVGLLTCGCGISYNKKIWQNRQKMGVLHILSNSVFLNIFSKLIPLKYIKKQIHKTQYKYADKETNYVANFSDVYFDKLILEKKLVRKGCPYQFENTTLMGIEDYDPYLKFYFNDYMTPPPVNERENQHGILKVEFYNEKKKID